MDNARQSKLGPSATKVVTGLVYGKADEIVIANVKQALVWLADARLWEGAPSENNTISLSAQQLVANVDDQHVGRSVKLEIKAPRMEQGTQQIQAHFWGDLVYRMYLALLDEEADQSIRAVRDQTRDSVDLYEVRLHQAREQLRVPTHVE